MVWTIFILILGFGFTIKGADFLVKGASSLARRYGVPELVIGLTIVAFGTSTPELVVNTIASIEGHSNIVLGNIIGSNNFNSFIILGISALIFPLTIHRSLVLKEIPYSLIAALTLLILANDMLLFDSRQDILGRVDGFILLGFFAVFIIYIVSNLQRENMKNTTSEDYYPMPKTLLLLGGGLAGLIFGGKLAVDNAIALAQMLGVSERIIGLTIVAAGTSLPELATSAVAAYHKKPDIAIGNVVGSSIFNIFFILAVSLLIAPVPYPVSFNVDLTLLISGTILLLMFTYTGKKAKVDRWEGIILIAIYAGYTIFLLK